MKGPCSDAWGPVIKGRAVLLSTWTLPRNSATPRLTSTLPRCRLQRWRPQHPVRFALAPRSPVALIALAGRAIHRGPCETTGNRPPGKP